MSAGAKKIFLTAQWRQLAMLNYEIAPASLNPWLPAGTELDLWDGKALVSLVGFLFLKTRVWRIAFPFHGNFEEVNLRFYVRRRAGDGSRRGVVFIKEIVPRAAIAFAARKFYNENYVALPMGHALTENSAEYWWRFNGRLNRIKVTTRPGSPGVPPAGSSTFATGQPKDLMPASEAEFITEHYWGYSRQPDGSTMEYKVEHPPWRVREAIDTELHGDIAGLYGPMFQDVLSGKPHSAFLAEGSKVTVYCGKRCPMDPLS